MNLAEISIVQSSAEFGYLAPQVSEVSKDDKHFSFTSKKRAEKALGYGNFLLAFNSGQMIGWIESLTVEPGKIGVSSLYVKEEFRGRGIGSKLLQVFSIEHQEDFVYMPTTEDWVAKKITDLGFVETPLIKLPKLFLFKYFRKRFFNRDFARNFHTLFNPYRYYLRYPVET